MSSTAAEITEKLFVEHRGRLVSYLRNRGSIPGVQAQDMVQQAFLDFYRHVKQFKEMPKEPLAYLYRTAYNVLRMQLRDKKMDGLLDQVDSMDIFVDAISSSPEDQLAIEQRLEEVAIAINTLPNKCRRAFMLRKVYELSYKEVAEHEGISVNTAKTYVRRGFEGMQARLKK